MKIHATVVSDLQRFVIFTLSCSFRWGWHLVIIGNMPKSLLGPKGIVQVVF